MRISRFHAFLLKQLDKLEYFHYLSGRSVFRQVDNIE